MTSRIKRHVFALTLLAGSFFTRPLCARDLLFNNTGEATLTLKSSLKTDWLGSSSVDGSSGEGTSSDLFGRLRFEPNYKINSEWSVDLAWDLQALHGTSSAATQVLQPLAPGYFRTTPLGSITRHGSTTIQQELDRAWVAYQPVLGNFTFGRQAIGWGRGVLFSAVDIFAPFSPLDFDREWRRGVDALRGDIKLSDSISLDMVAAPGTNPNASDSPVALNDSAYAARVRGNLGNWDAELIAGRRGADKMLAFTTSRPLKDMEVHAEAAVFRVPGDIPDAGMFGDPDLVPKAVIGASNRFDVGQGLTIAAEYHYSGFGVADIRTLPDRLKDPSYLNRYLRGDSQITGKQAFALQATYTISSVLEGGLNILQSATDNSGVLAPSLSWDFSESVTLSANGLWAYGASSVASQPRSEFGGTPTTLMLQIRIYN